MCVGCGQTALEKKLSLYKGTESKIFFWLNSFCRKMLLRLHYVPCYRIILLQVHFSENFHTNCCKNLWRIIPQKYSLYRCVDHSVQLRVYLQFRKISLILYLKENKSKTQNRNHFLMVNFNN